MKERKYSYNRFGSTGTRVGQAVADLWDKDPVDFTVEELMEHTNLRFLKEMDDCIKKNVKKYDGIFHIFVLGKKELTQFGVTNVDRNWFIARKSPPDISQMMMEYPHFCKTLYEIDPKGDVKLKWSVPGWEDCKSIKKNPRIYDPDLVKWVSQATKKWHKVAS